MTHLRPGSAVPRFWRHARRGWPVALFLLMLARGLEAQQDPFQPPAAAPVPAAGTGEPAGAAPATEAAAAPEPRSAANRLILETIRRRKPTAPEDLARAVETLLDAKEFAECKTYLQQLAASAADEATQARLVRQVGPALMLRLASTTELAPEGAAFARQVLAAARRVAADPARLNMLVTRLQDPQQRQAAISGLRDAHDDAVPVLVAVLRDASQTQLHRPVQSALVALGEDAIEPLLATLDAGDGALLERVAHVLAASGDPRAVPALVELVLRADLSADTRDNVKRLVEQLQRRPISMAEAERKLAAEFRDAFELGGDEPPVVERVPHWRWDAGAGQLIRQEMSAADMARWRCARRARVLAGAAPQNQQYAIWQLAAQLEWDQAQQGTDQFGLAAGRGSELAREAGPDRINEVLAACLAAQRVAGAVGAAEALAEFGSERQLMRHGMDSPLVAALQFPDSDVQFAATHAIIRVNPQQPFAGGGRFQHALGRFLDTRPQRRLLVVNQRVDEGQTLAGWFAQLGWHADVALTGDDALRQATANPDYECVLLSDGLQDPPTDELLQLLRREPLLGTMRLGILARELNYGRLRLLTAEDPWLLVLARPRDMQSIQVLLRELDRLPGQRPANPEVRTARAETVLDWLALTLDRPTAENYELLRLEAAVIRLVENSPLSSKAARVLGGFGTHRAQQRLVDVASQNAFPLDVRRAAVTAFAASAKRFGIRLTSGEILQQYHLYNASEKEPAEIQQILGQLLDAIERKAP